MKNMLVKPNSMLLKKTILKPLNAYTVFTCLLVLLLVKLNCYAKNQPKLSPTRQLAFKRAKSLDNGISISWLEQTWAKDILNENALQESDFRLLKTIGFKALRLPVAFEYMQAHDIPIQKVFSVVDNVVKLCHKYNLKLVIDYHYGTLDDQNYTEETRKIIATWAEVAKHFAYTNPDDVLYEIYNEPPHMNPQLWKDAAYNIVTALRKLDKNRTFIVGASNFNSIYELSRMDHLADDNVIYTFHFYEPFLFTHQGASWAGQQEATTGVPFPYIAEKFPAINPQSKSTWGETNYYQYPKDGNEQSVLDKLTIVKKWGDKYQVPLLCGEYGAYAKYADTDSRCRYIKAVRTSLKTLGIPGMLWEYNSAFSLFEGKPSLETLPECMKDALGYH